jgi:hypothetical protein
MEEEHFLEVLVGKSYEMRLFKRPLQECEGKYGSYRYRLQGCKWLRIGPKAYFYNGRMKLPVPVQQVKI